MMQELIELALHAEHERVRSVCAVAVLDRAGVRPTDFDPSENKSEQPAFNPRAYTFEELDLIEAGLRLVLEGRQE